MRDIFIQRALRVLEDNDVHLDASETAFLERELTQLRTKVFEVVYPDLLGRKFVPLASDIAASADKYSFKVWNKTGLAKVGAHDSDDAPRIDVSATEITGKVYPIIASYGWGMNELREAARTGTPLSDQKSKAARDAIERGIDEMLANGYTPQTGETNLITTGLLNNGDVDDTIDSWTKWTSATSVATILGDLNTTVGNIVSGSKQRWIPDTIVLPTPYYNIIATKMVGTDNDTTILRSFLNNNPYIKNVEQWYRADSIGTNSTGRALVYKKDPMVLEGVVPSEFEQLPPQARNYEFVVPCIARCGGVKVYQPTAMRYADFAA
jgi:hypothetical protein